jgi:hypothetical protein
MTEYATFTEPAPRNRLADAVPKAGPALATSTVLILARIWNATGAEHSTGDAWLMGTLAVGAALAGGMLSTGRHGDGTAAALAFTAAGTIAFGGIAAYTDGLPLPLLLWGIATVLGYVMAARYWRTDRRDTVAYQRATVDRRETQRHIETVELIRGRTAVDVARVQIDVARESTARAEAIVAAITARAALPGYNPAALVGDGLRELPAAADSKGVQ